MISLTTSNDILLHLVFFVSASYCAYWTTSLDRLDINMDHVGHYTTTNSVLSCTMFCSKPHHMFLFYFSPGTQKCYCSKKREAFTADLSHEKGVLGKLKLNRDCLDYYQKGYMYDDYFTIDPRPSLPVTVWCDMKNGGWTNIQRRLDGSVNFYRNWTEYVRGFGNADGEVWLGLDNIHTLTQEPSELFIYMETFGDRSPFGGYAWYSYFNVANESKDYRLSLSLDGYKGNVTDSFGHFHNGMPFSTYDRDKDIDPRNCAVRFKGAWWYKTCHNCNLNGIYLGGPHTEFAIGINWKNPWGQYYSLKKVTMRIKRITN